MDLMEIIKTRKSIRTFDGRQLASRDTEKLREYIKDVPNPYDIPVKFLMLDAEEYGLSSPVIAGERYYLTAIVPKTEHCEEAFGYSFEKVVLYAWSLGIGTTWIGGTMKRELFEEASRISAGELMPCISPLGYPAKKKSVKEIAMRAGVGADKRKPGGELFFENDFSSKLVVSDKKLADALEAVRLAPSAVNKQPWRIVKCGNDYHFFEYQSLSERAAAWDIQKIDMGIALYHFISLTDGKLTVREPSLEVPKNTEYIATVTV